MIAEEWLGAYSQRRGVPAEIVKADQVFSFQLSLDEKLDINRNYRTMLTPRANLIIIHLSIRVCQESISLKFRIKFVEQLNK